AVARGLVDSEGLMPHAQPGVTAGFGISRRTAESPDEEISQAPLSGRQITALVHWPKDLIGRDPAIKRPHKPTKSVFADQPVDVGFLQRRGLWFNVHGIRWQAPGD